MARVTNGRPAFFAEMDDATIAGVDDVLGRVGMTKTEFFRRLVAFLRNQSSAELMIMLGVIESDISPGLADMIVAARATADEAEQGVLDAQKQNQSPRSKTDAG